jgi:uncharacterized protein
MSQETTYTSMYKDIFQKHETWLYDNLLFEVTVGSHAYGCNTEDSDFDFIALSMDQHQCLFPQQYGLVLGFDNTPKFNSKDLKGPSNKLKLGNKEVEGKWHSLTNFFHLAGLKGSPDLVELLFVRQHLVKYCHPLFTNVRDNRRLFLSLQCLNTFRGYAFQQLTRLKREKARWDRERKCDNLTRRVLYETFGYDVKMSYHIIRLLDQLNQLVLTGDMELMCAKDECKRMRSGEWGTFEQLEEYTMKKLSDLESATFSSPLPKVPQTEPLRQLLLSCVEQWYGTVDKAQKQSEFVSAKDVWERLDRLENTLNLNNKSDVIYK